MPSQREEIPIARRQGVAKSKFVSAQSLVNVILEQDPETGDFSRHGAAGLSLLANVATGNPVRGLHDFNGVLLAVIGTSLYTVTQAGSATNQGVIEGTEPVIIANNGFEAAIVADEITYVWDGSALAQVTDPDFQQSTSVAFIDQYLVFTIYNSGSFQISALADAESYDALDVASAETQPDKLRRVIVQGGEVLLFGDKSLEGWDDVGDADFPLARGPTRLGIGIIGKLAVAEIDNSIAWMAPDKSVRILRGGTPQVISDPFIVAEIERWTDASITQAFTISMRGHEYLVLRNPDGCLLWDASLPANLAWSSRKSYGSDTWRVACAETMATWGGVVVLGDATDGKLYTLSQNVYSENGEPIVWEIISRTIGPGGRPFTCDAIEIEAEPGVSLVSGQGSDAKIWLQLSRDSGYTYGARRERSLGAIGERDHRIIWRRNGQFPLHGGVFKIGGSDPVALTLTRAWADIEPDAT